MPSEPAESNFRSKVHATAYPTQERGGLVWIYMGPREVPPPLPDLEANMLPEGEYTIGAYSSECNWLQSLEGDYDTIHLGFLHQGSIRPRTPSPARLELLRAQDALGPLHVTERHRVRLHLRLQPPGRGRHHLLAHRPLPLPLLRDDPDGPLGKRRIFIAVVPIDDENCIRFTMNEPMPGESNPAPRSPSTTA